MKASQIVGALVLSVCVSAAADAATVSYTDVFDPATDPYFGSGGGTCIGTNTSPDTSDTVSGVPANGKCATLTYSHMLVGFSDPPDTLTSATLKLYLYDGDISGNDSEAFTILILNTAFSDSGTITNLSDAGSPFTATWSVLSYVTSTGLLSDVRVGFSDPDFYFAKSELFGEWTEAGADPLPSVVPEPGSLALFGSGLVGLRAYLRRRRKSA